MEMTLTEMQGFFVLFCFIYQTYLSHLQSLQAQFPPMNEDRGKIMVSFQTAPSAVGHR